ncbi:MAG TPA: response regulator [Candidatus Angelobacter sp.]|jgi:CheY-like chemotaxis protein|nr:response regulator [Candidatus Angelobacter sp.]
MESKTKLPFINLRSPEPADRMTLPKKPKILMVDNDPKGRKARINILRAHGFSAYPALNMQQAMTRCKPGAYDLIVVNPRDEKEPALEFCDAIKKQNPQQLLLLMTPADQTTDTEGTVSDNPQMLLERVQAMFPKHAAVSEVSAAA